MKKSLLLLFSTIICFSSWAQIIIPPGNASTGADRRPLASWYGHERSQNLYLSSEINQAGNITSIAYFSTAVNSNVTAPTKIYMQEITATTLNNSLSWDATQANLTANATLVYDGSLTTNLVVGSWFDIPLTTPYSYGGGNLLITVVTDQGGFGNGPSLGNSLANSSTAPDIRALYWNTDNNPPTTGTGTTTTSRPNILINVANTTTPDLALSKVLSPVAVPGCAFSNTEQLSVVIRNQGVGTQSNFTISYSINGVAGTPFTYTGVLNTATSDTVLLSSSADFSATGSVNLEVYLTNANDANRRNDTLRETYVNNPLWTGVVDFNGFTGSNLPTVHTGWYEANRSNLLAPSSTSWQNNDADDLALLGNTTAKINLYASTTKQAIVGPATLVPADADLSFESGITAFFSGTPVNNMGTDDSLNVLISTNCGTTWNTIFSLNASSSVSVDLLTEYKVSLLPYAGQVVRFAFYATEGSVNDPEDYYMHLTQIEVIPRLAIDAGVRGAALASGVSCLPGSAESISVNVINQGNNALQAPIPLSYTINNGTPVTESLNVTLAPDSSVRFTFTTPANLSAAGNYEVKVAVTFPTDSRLTNDTSRFSVSNAGAMTYDFPHNFNGLSGGNVEALHQGWYQRGGHNATTNTARWNAGNAAQQTHFGSTTIETNIWATNNRGWLITKPINLLPNSSVVFKSALTDFADIFYSPFGSDDTLAVYLSSDCGATWNLIKRFDDPTEFTENLQTYTISLAGYSGSNFRIGFYGSSGNVNDNEDFDWHLQDVTIEAPVANDVRALALLSPANDCSLDNPTNFVVRVENSGTSPASNFAVNYRVNGGPVQTETVAGPIAPQATVDVTFPTAVNLSTAGTYNVEVSTALAGDMKPFNDAVTSTLVRYTAPFGPYNFNNFNGRNINAILPGAEVGGGASFAVASTITGGNYAGLPALQFPMDGSVINWFVSPSVSVNAVNPTLVFKISADGGAMPASSTVEVRVSTDCGATWTVNSTIQGNTITGSWVERLVPLSLNNQTYKVALVVNSGGGAQGVNLNITDLELRGFAAIDAAVTAISSPPQGMDPGVSYPVTIRVRNLGTTALTQVPVTVNLGTRTFTGTINNLAVSATVNYTFPSSIMQPFTAPASGCVQGVGIVSAANDNITSNDTLNTQVCIVSIGQLLDESSVSLYPNPSKGDLTVELPAAFQNFATVVYGVDGKTVAHSFVQVAEGVYRLQMNAKSAGLYLFQASNGDEAVQRRFVIE